ncbi:MAG: hypothetical protein V4697_00600 [Patescibacteria group bacterium]
MNRNLTPIILIALSAGIYFTFTQGKIEEFKEVQVVNAGYQQALDNSEKLIKVRDAVLKSYNEIAPEDRERLNKLLPDNVDNVRLIIDVNGVAARHGLPLKNIKTNASPSNSSSNTVASKNTGKINVPSTYDTVSLSFNVTTNYETFITFLRDLEASLRIMDITKITLDTDESGNYDYGVELKTYWLKQ